MTMSIEQRLQVLEDIQEINQLKASYCNSVDCGWSGLKQDGERVAPLFIEDGVWDAIGVLRLEGRDAIRNFFNASPFPFGFHRVSNPAVKVDGDRASGQWHLLCPAIDANKQPIWIGGIYNDEFVRTAEGWKFKRLTVRVAFTSRNEQGWEYNSGLGM